MSPQVSTNYNVIEVRQFDKQFKLGLDDMTNLISQYKFYFMETVYITV